MYIPPRASARRTFTTSRRPSKLRLLSTGTINHFGFTTHWPTSFSKNTSSTMHTFKSNKPNRSRSLTHTTWVCGSTAGRGLSSTMRWHSLLSLRLGFAIHHFGKCFSRHYRVSVRAPQSRTQLCNPFSPKDVHSSASQSTFCNRSSLTCISYPISFVFSVCHSSML